MRRLPTQSRTHRPTRLSLRAPTGRLRRSPTINLRVCKAVLRAIAVQLTRRLRLHPRRGPPTRRLPHRSPILRQAGPRPHPKIVQSRHHHTTTNHRPPLTGTRAFLPHQHRIRCRPTGHQLHNLNHRQRCNQRAQRPQRRRQRRKPARNKRNEKARRRRTRVG